MTASLKNRIIETMQQIKISLGKEYAFFSAIGVALLLLIVLNVPSAPHPLGILRIILGIGFPFFVPGYLLLVTLFPGTVHFDTLERLALSFVLSVSLIPVEAIGIQYSPWPLTIVSITFVQTLASIFFGALSLLVRRRMPVEERFVWTISGGFQSWWSHERSSNRLTYIFAAILLVVVVFSALLVIVRPPQFSTEFYILGPDDLAQNFPREDVVGQPVTVIVGVTNREGQNSRYRIEVSNNSQLIGQIDWFGVNDQQTVQQNLTFTPVDVNDNSAIIIDLYRDGQTTAYRELRLWMKVTNPE